MGRIYSAGDGKLPNIVAVRVVAPEANSEAYVILTFDKEFPIGVFELLLKWFQPAPLSIKFQAQVLKQVDRLAWAFKRRDRTYKIWRELEVLYLMQAL